MLGKEAAVYVPSGSMGNLVSVRSHTRPGDEIFIHEAAHIVVHEQGGVAALAGAQTRMLPGESGVLDPELLERYLRDPARHPPRPPEPGVRREHRGRARWAGLPAGQAAGRSPTGRTRTGSSVHMDGARIWNAAVAIGLSPAEVAAPADSLSVCFSKGLGAPVGSAVVGSAEFIERARRNRKLFGGGMRQAGIIAAGALHALRHHVDRLADDHRNARALALGPRRRRAALQFDPDAVQTNIVISKVIDGSDADALAAELAQAGILCAALDARTIRFVTHLDVDSEAVAAAVEQATPVLS